MSQDMPKESSSIWVEVNLGQLRRNQEIMQRIVGDNVGIIVCVKANGYGHGAVAVARTVLANGAYGVCVASVEEARQLRQANINGMVLVLGRVHQGQMEEAIRRGLTVTVESVEEVRNLSEIARLLGKEVKVHIKIDTGMARRGVWFSQIGDIVELASEVYHLPGLIPEGIYTHFTQSDEPDLGYTHKQLERFKGVISLLQEAGICPQVIHAANSPTTLRLGEEAYFTAVRMGQVIYGYLSSATMPPLPEGVYPALKFMTRIGPTKPVPAGTPVGYGAKNVVTRDTLVATIDAGFAYGLRKNPSHQGYVVVNGVVRVPILAVAMNTTVVDVTEVVGKVRPGSEVEIFGGQLPLEEVTRTLGFGLASPPLVAIPSEIKRFYTE